jgi:DNA-binding PadR family transcriptional regulator
MSPVFAHGQLRLYLLALLDEAPRHGYEVIRALEERFAGLYVPSAGSVYPRLSRLEDEGLITRTDEGRTAVYRITDAGRAEVRARADDVAALQRDLEDSVRRLAAEVRDRVRADAKDLRAELKLAAREARRAATSVGNAPAAADAPASNRAAEDALRSFVTEVRGELRRHGLDETGLAQLTDVLDESRRAISALLTGNTSSDRPSSKEPKDKP